jgi:hypothetical protein
MIVTNGVFSVQNTFGCVIVRRGASRLGTEVANERLQAGFPRGRVYIAVMVPRDGYDRSVVIEIGLVKFRPVVCAFSVIIDDIAQVIEKRGPIGWLAVCHIAFHECAIHPRCTSECSHHRYRRRSETRAFRFF